MKTCEGSQQRLHKRGGTWEDYFALNRELVKSERNENTSFTAVNVDIYMHVILESATDKNVSASSSRQASYSPRQLTKIITGRLLA